MLTGQNLIINPSAESNPTSNGWTQVSGNWQQRSVSPLPHHGSRYFFAGSNASAEIYQDIDVSSYIANIDSGNQEFVFSGYTSSWPNQGVDDSRLIVEYRDIGGTILDSYDSGWSQSTTWIQHTDTRIAPISTRIIRVRILAKRDSGNNNDGYTDNLSLTVGNILPVELSFFKAVSIDESIRLSWETASELNNQGFEVQKSIDGNIWEKIGVVEGNGTTVEVQNYTFDDITPYSGINYYRLKQTDFNGTFEYSNVITERYDFIRNKIKVFPNPSNGFINIHVDYHSSEIIGIKITNNLGAIVWENIITEKTSFWRKEIELEENGIYFVSVITGNQVKNKTIIIAH